VATVAEYLTTAREGFAQQLAELSDPTKRRPSYSIGGRSVQWPAYMDFLLAAIQKIDAQLAAEEGEPVTLVTSLV
jgi:hypothetical protein